MKNSRIQIKFQGFQIQVSRFPKILSATNTSQSFRQVSKNYPKKISGFQLAKPACPLVQRQVSKFPDFTTSITWRVNNPPCMEWRYRFCASLNFALLSTKNSNRHEQQKNFSSRSRHKNWLGNQITRPDHKWHYRI